MAIHARTADYKSDGASTNLHGGRAPARTQPSRLPEAGRADECLQLLARAVQQSHTYPPTSPLCHNAVEAYHRALASNTLRDQLDFRVTPNELIVEEAAIGRGSLVGYELAHRLHAAAIAQVTMERAASIREIAWFCLDLVHSSSRREKRANLIELLSEHGVNRILLRPAYRPEVLQIAPPAAPVASLVDQQRERREELFAQGGVVDHLYPPDKGWVRLDPSSQLPNVSLVDLALMSDDPATLATMLLRLTDDDVSENVAPAEALSQKFSDVAMLFSALDPRIARVMFAKLARGVLDLDPDSRQTLLRRTILPGLLDGKIDGIVLRDFPDLDLADSLCLLLDLETAAPEVVTTALARLDLPAERHEAVLPLINERLAGRSPGAGGRDQCRRARAQAGADGPRAGQELRGVLGVRSRARPTRARRSRPASATDIAASDVLSEQLACLWRLVRLEANPDVVQRFCAKAIVDVEQLEREERWQTFAVWLARFSGLAERAGASRALTSPTSSRPSLAQFCTVERAAQLVEPGRPKAAAASRSRRHDRHGARAADRPALAVARPGASSRRQGSDEPCRRSTAVPTTRARSLLRSSLRFPPQTPTPRGSSRAFWDSPAPATRRRLRTSSPAADEQTVREALRSLARIGTPRAAAHVRAAVEQRDGWLSTRRRGNALALPTSRSAPAGAGSAGAA